MLAIRLQRTGRRGHAQFRMIVQEARLSPKSGKVVALLGNYNPHNKELHITKDKAEFYLKHGAQPSDRAARLLKADGVNLPAWVELEPKKERAIKSPEKLRKNRPAEPVAETDESSQPEEVEAPAESTPEGAPEPEEPARTETEEASPEAAAETTEEPKEQ